jgi:hypothetical protein
MFFFQLMFQQVYTGITGSTTLTSVETIAQTIALLCALFGAYEAYARGGDTRALAVTSARYLFIGLLLTQYSNVFLNINNAANNLAQAISPTDVWTNFRTQIGNYLSSPAGAGAWYNLIPGGIAGLVSVLLQAIALEVFPITYVFFSFFYSMYGAMLYVVGPLVLALYPAFGVGQLARTYMLNLLIWNSWGILYAVMSQLLTIMTAGSLTSVLSAGTFGGAFAGASQMLLISMSSILLSLMIAVIPFIAKRIISGDVGSTLFTALAVAGAAIQSLAIGSFGMTSGSGGHDPDPPGPPPNDPGGKGNPGGNPRSPSERAPTPPEDPGDPPPQPPGGGDGSASSNAAPSEPSDTMTSRPSSGGEVAVREMPKSAGGGGGGHPPDDPGGGGSRSSSGLRQPYVSGLYYIPYAVGWSVGRAGQAATTAKNYLFGR